MSGGITIGFVDVAVFLSQSGRFLRFGCVVSGAKLVWSRLLVTSIDLYRRTRFRMIIERIDLALSRLKQGFDFP